MLCAERKCVMAKKARKSKGGSAPAVVRRDDAAFVRAMREAAKQPKEWFLWEYKALLVSANPGEPPKIIHEGSFVTTHMGSAERKVAASLVKDGIISGEGDELDRLRIVFRGCGDGAIIS